MSFGLETFDANGTLTFDMGAAIIKDYLTQYLPANSSGFIDMSMYPANSTSISFIRANFNSFDSFMILPFVTFTGTGFNWQTSGQACYAMVSGVVR